MAFSIVPCVLTPQKSHSPQISTYTRNLVTQNGYGGISILKFTEHDNAV
jgi:hypothetical protein